MRNVLMGAGVAVLLGLFTGMVGWRWAVARPRRTAALVDATTVPTGNRSRVASTDIASHFNSTSSISEAGGVSSADNFTSHTLADLSAANSTEHLTLFGFYNESSALNSSLFKENNDTEVSFGSEDSNRNSSLPTNSTEDDPENPQTILSITPNGDTTLPLPQGIARNTCIGNNREGATPTVNQDIDYVKMGQELLTEATTILDTGIWDFERRTEDGDAIFSRQLDNGNMVYRLTGIVDMPPQDLLVVIWDGLPDYPKWNPTLLECRVLEKINDQTDISYTVSTPGARGYVASRDFVSLRHWELRHNTYIAASRSITFPGAPSNPDYIRGRNGPGCMELRPLSSDPSKTEFRWLLNTKLNGWIPSYIADKAYKKFMTKYMIFLREYCRIIKQRATDFTQSSTTPRNITE